MGRTPIGGALSCLDILNETMRIGDKDTCRPLETLFDDGQRLLYNNRYI